MNLTYKFILTLFCCSQSVLFAGPVQEKKDLRLLELGKPIERELAGGQAHTYQITCASDQFFSAVVDQRGIDVVVTLIGPDEKKVIEVDSPNGTNGPEALLLILEYPGNYKLEIRSLEKDAAAGRYQINIEALRLATTQDKTLVAAENAFKEGDSLYSQFTKESLRTAIEKYNQALQLFETVGNKLRMSNTLKLLGNIYDILRDFQKALDSYKKALEYGKAVGDSEAQARPTMNIGLVYLRMGELSEAEKYFVQSLPLWKAANSGIGQAMTYGNLSLIYTHLGEFQKALDSLNQALPLWQADGNRSLGDLGKNYSNIGDVYSDLGEYHKALEYYSQSLKMAELQRDKFEESRALSNIGYIYIQRGDYRQALAYLNKSLPLIVDHPEEGGLRGNILNNMAVAHRLLGEYDKALDYNSQALALCRSLGTRKGEAQALIERADICRLLGRIDEAYELYSRAKPLAKAVSALNVEAEALSDLALIEVIRGNLNNARNLIEANIDIIESLRLKVGKQDLRASYLAASLDSYKLHIDILGLLHKQHPLDAYDAIALQTNERARARSLLELLSDAHAEVRQGGEPALLEREKRLLERIDAKERYRIELLNSKHSQEELSAVEKELSALQNDYDDVRYQIRATSPRYAALTQPQPLTFKEIQQQVLDPETLLLEYSLGEERSYLWVASQSSLNTFVLPKGDDIDKAARHVYQLLTVANQQIKGETPEQQITRLSHAETDYVEASAALSRMILAPAADLLGKKRLLVVTDGALQYIPFSALPAPVNASQPLALTNEVVYLPSASTLAILRREFAGRQTASKAVAVLADPVFSRDDPRLTSPGKAHIAQPVQPEETATSGTRDLERAVKDSGLSGEGFRIPRLLYSRREAEAIATAAKGTAFKALDFDASRAVATGSDLSQYRIVHFATHGLLNSEHPELSGIVLSLVNRQGEPQNGFLRLQDVFNLRLNADLVVLSACQTGLGKEIKGEGLIGLTRGFMYAGAARVLASLWKVDDAATAELMKRFYSKVLTAKMRPAAALREAQIEMWQLKRWQSPYFWAAFTLQGEWR